MSKKSSRGQSGKDFLQFRIERGDKRGAELIAKLEKIKEANGLSLNTIANMAVAAGLQMVESKLTEIHDPQKQAA